MGPRRCGIFSHYGGILVKALVTGSAGHLGEALVRTLRETGAEVTGLDLVPSATTDQVGSIGDRSAVRRAVAGAEVVYHAATLHKPHVGTHAMQAFVETNVTGTLVLLEEAARAAVEAFVFTSTTSAFGNALRPPPGRPAVWVTEALVPVPRNIYGVTKTAAEDLCGLVHAQTGLACIILRTSRFFPEPDDDPSIRAGFEDENVKANEFLFRRVELEDVVDAHLCAATRAPELRFGMFIVSATTPFLPEDLIDLNHDAPSVVARRVPGYQEIYAERGWRMFDTIGRVYVNAAARRALGWEPTYDFARVLESLRAGVYPRSPIAETVGSKGYH